MSPLQEGICAPPAAAGAEQRRHVRYLCLDGDVIRLAVRPVLGDLRVLMLDLSFGGVGFILQQPLEVGTLLALQLGGSDAEGVTRRARVRHCRPHPAPPNAPWLPPSSAVGRFFRWLVGLPAQPGQGQAWLAGCEFTQPLDEQELKVVLGLLGILHDGK
jgi:hypothetical protein